MGKLVFRPTSVWLLNTPALLGNGNCHFPRSPLINWPTKTLPSLLQRFLLCLSQRLPRSNMHLEAPLRSPAWAMTSEFWKPSPSPPLVSKKLSSESTEDLRRARLKAEGQRQVRRAPWRVLRHHNPMPLAPHVSWEPKAWGYGVEGRLRARLKD